MDSLRSATVSQEDGFIAMFCLPQPLTFSLDVCRRDESQYSGNDFVYTVSPGE
jgi:hypothetical protein